MHSGEVPLHVDLFSAANRDLKARFEGFYYSSSLSAQLVGTYIDSTDPENIITQNVAFMKVTTSELRF